MIGNPSISAGGGKMAVQVLLLASVLNGLCAGAARAQAPQPRTTASAAGGASGGATGVFSDEAQAQIRALRQQAQAAFQARDWQRAIDLYGQILQRDGSDAMAHRFRSYAYGYLEQHEAAIAHARSALALEPRSANAHNSLCWALILAARWDEAQPVCAAGQAIDPMDLALSVNLANTYLLQGRREQAWRWYEQAIGLMDNPQDLQDGLQGDLEIFQRKGWQPELTARARAEWLPRAQAWLRAVEQARPLAAQAESHDKAKAPALALQARQQRWALLSGQLAEGHPRRQAMQAALVDTQEALGDQLAAAGRHREAIVHYQAVLQHKRRLHGGKPASGQGELITPLNDLATAYQYAGDYPAALPLFEEALAIAEAARGAAHPSTGTSLNDLAVLYASMGQYARAEPLYVRALAIAEKAEGAEHPSTGIRLNNLAGLYRAMGQYAKAEPLSVRALAIAEKTQGPDHPSTGIRLNSLALLYESMGQYARAEPLYVRALAIAEKAEGAEHPSTGTLLNNLANLYQAMGQYAKAEPLYVRALAIAEKAQGAEHPETGTRLNNLANLYQAMGQYAKAEPLYGRALAIAEKAQGAEHPETGTRLNNLAVLYDSMGQYAKAEPLYVRALAIAEKAEGAEHPSTGNLLNNLAGLYESMGQYAKAEPLYVRALAIAQVAESPRLRFDVQRALARFHRTQGRTPVAIFFGKQAVNTFQQIRSQTRGVDDASQRSLLERNQAIYEELANWLVGDGRLAEAEQVLAMLKQQELYELTRRTAASDAGSASVSASGAEVGLQRQWDELRRTGVAQAVELEALNRWVRQGGSLDAQQQARRRELQGAQVQWRAALQRYLGGLQAALSSDPAAAAAQRKEIEQGADRLRSVIRSANEQSGQRHVALSYIVTDEALSVIVTTAEGAFAKQTSLKREELNRRIGELRAALNNPKVDPRGPAQALYGLLIGPVQQELDKLQASALVLNLSNTLRYIPFAALHDGQQYLVQRYSVALYTSAGGAKVQAQPTQSWQVAGLGLTQATRVEGRAFEALPGVAGELEAIVRTGASPRGVLPGQVLLNTQFNEASFEQALARAGSGQASVVHVASHFHLSPGSEHGSYLVLGDGQPLRLSRIKEMDFNGVQLLTLSACDTASQGGRNDNGSEVEGLAAAVQVAGAASVVATLWPVADASTAQLMQGFYRLRTQAGKEAPTHAQALRQAQLQLLGGARAAQAASGEQRGARLAPAAAQAAGGTGETPSGANPAGATAAFVPSPEAPYAHPYFWAPFVLMGNWL